MSRTILKILLVLCLILLAAEFVFLIIQLSVPEEDVTPPPETSAEAPGTSGASTQESTTEPSQPETSEPEVTEPTETQPMETEPGEIRYTLTFAGDCTLASDPGNYASAGGFIQTIGTDYDYPFRNVRDIFAGDDFTIVNLESVLADEGLASNKLFTFRGPTAYTNILTGSSVEAVTLANNHTQDYGQAGYASTKEALEGAGVAYVEENKTRLYTTESGLVIGLYADSFTFNYAEIKQNVQKLRSQGAQIVICAFHWGTEGSYRANGNQQSFAQAAIDAGADIVYGHHPHVLQKIETYKNGVIFYSLGNFSFGGNHFPRDMDSAIIQMEVIRDENGKVTLGEMTIIPVSISSMKGQNNFQPTPLTEGSEEYDRVLSKLDGTFTGPDLIVDYSHLQPTDPSEPTEPSTGETEPPGTDAPPAPTDAPEPPPASEAPAPPPQED